jgi:prolyl 4-hydroxylase
MVVHGGLARSRWVREAAKQGGIVNSIEALARATQTGDVEALTQLGKRLLVGDEVPLLPQKGAGFLIEAANRGGAEAAARLAVLAAAGVGVQQSWNDALGLLIAAAERGWQPAQAQLLALTESTNQLPPSTGCSVNEQTSWPQLGATVDLAWWLGAAPPGRTLSAEPRVRAFERLIPDRVCDWLIRHARPRLVRARVYDSIGEREAVSETRTNSAASFNLMEAELAQLLVQARMAAACGLPLRNMEAPAVLHYEVGQQITDHYDFIDPASPNYAAQIARQGQRAVTFLVYLNDEYAGGETDFPRLSVRHKGQRGEGLYFVNALADGAPDRRALHAGLPPARGEKWIVSQFIRGRALLGEGS